MSEPGLTLKFKIFEFTSVSGRRVYTALLINYFLGFEFDHFSVFAEKCSETTASPMTQMTTEREGGEGEREREGEMERERVGPGERERQRERQRERDRPLLHSSHSLQYSVKLKVTTLISL